MNDSILTSIKGMLGLAKDYTSFDNTIIMHINSVFMVLSQLGIGPTGGYRITDKNNEWYEYISDKDNLDSVKSYMYLKVKLMFDPPTNSYHTEAIKQEINELEWRLTNH